MKRIEIKSLDPKMKINAAVSEFKVLDNIDLSDISANPRPVEIADYLILEKGCDIVIIEIGGIITRYSKKNTSMTNLNKGLQIN